MNYQCSSVSTLQTKADDIKKILEAGGIAIDEAMVKTVCQKMEGKPLHPRVNAPLRMIIKWLVITHKWLLATPAKYHALPNRPIWATCVVYV